MSHAGGLLSAISGILAGGILGFGAAGWCVLQDIFARSCSVVLCFFFVSCARSFNSQAVYYLLLYISHFSVWNRKYMEPVLGNDLRHMWQECEPAIGRKIKASYDIRAEDIRRCAAFVTTLPPPSAPESLLTLGTPAQQQCPPLNSTLAQRTRRSGHVHCVRTRRLPSSKGCKRVSLP